MAGILKLSVFLGLLGVVLGQAAQSNGEDSANLRLREYFDSCSAFAGVPPSNVYRTLDGRCNSLYRPAWGAAGRGQTRFVRSDSDAMTGQDLPEPRIISNAICDQGSGSPESKMKLSQSTIFFGQFIDHTITATGSDSGETLSMFVPENDRFFSRNNVSVSVLPFTRSVRSQDGENGYTPVNSLSSFLDLSSVYGAEDRRTNAIRTKVGGMVGTSKGDMLQFNEEQLRNAPSTAKSFYLAGDHRANEHAVLTSIHTIFVRSHNMFAADLGKQFDWDDENLFQEARRINIAWFQGIVFEEYLPAVLGSHEAPGKYRGYAPHIKPDLPVIFTTAAYRVGHSQVPNSISRRGPGNSLLPDLPLTEMFFTAPEHMSVDGVSPYIRGMLMTRAMEIDVKISDSIRNFLFSTVRGESAIDLISNNILRGRDHALPSYNTIRELYGFPKLRSWRQLTSDSRLRARMSKVYKSIDDVDAWVGMAAEDHEKDCNLGPLTARIWRHTFEALRAGDSLWYEREGLFKDEVRSTKYAKMIYEREARGGERSLFRKLIELTTDIDIGEIPRRPFFAIA